ncbi:MAG: metallophosphoesterase family protein, partial [Anaerolineae bacterium]
IPLGPERMIINPGSVGQPRDGHAEASYAILDLDAGTLQHRRVAYPLEKTQAKMMEYDLPLRLVLRLGYGW